jgi:hypothetical protein
MRQPEYWREWLNLYTFALCTKIKERKELRNGIAGEPDISLATIKKTD